MKDNALDEHYQQILGNTSPWTVSEVKLDVERLVNEVKLTVKPDAIWACPPCRSRMHIKEWRTRRWRHMDTCQFKTILEAAVRPRALISEPLRALTFEPPHVTISLRLG